MLQHFTLLIFWSCKRSIPGYVRQNDGNWHPEPLLNIKTVCSIVCSGADKKQNKTSKLRVTGLCKGNLPATGEFPAQKASNAENVSIKINYKLRLILGWMYSMKALIVIRVLTSSGVDAYKSIDPTYRHL